MPASRPTRGKQTATAFRYLRYVIAAAEQGSFRGAARLLGAQVSDLSRRVRDLEDEIGASLFIRHRSGVRPTYAGELFLERARRAIDQISSAEEEVVAVGRGERGIVRVGLSSSLVSGFIIELIEAYGTDHPEVRLDFVEAEKAEHIRAIRQHQLDIAFLAEVQDSEGCESAVLWTEKVHVAMPILDILGKQERIDWADLRDRRFVVSAGGIGPAMKDLIVGRLASRGRTPSIEALAIHQNTLLELVAAGRGLTLTAEANVVTKFRGLIYRALAAEFLSFGAIWSPSNDNPAFRRLLSLAKRQSGHF